MPRAEKSMADRVAELAAMAQVHKEAHALNLIIIHEIEWWRVQRQLPTQEEIHRHVDTFSDAMDKLAGLSGTAAAFAMTCRLRLSELGASGALPPPLAEIASDVVASLDAILAGQHPQSTERLRAVMVYKDPAGQEDA